MKIKPKQDQNLELLMQEEATFTKPKQTLAGMNWMYCLLTWKERKRRERFIWIQQAVLKQARENLLTLLPAIPGAFGSCTLSSLHEHLFMPISIYLHCICSVVLSKKLLKSRKYAQWVWQKIHCGDFYTVVWLLKLECAINLIPSS